MPPSYTHHIGFTAKDSSLKGFKPHSNGVPAVCAGPNGAGCPPLCLFLGGLARASCLELVLCGADLIPVDHCWDMARGQRCAAYAAHVMQPMSIESPLAFSLGPMGGSVVSKLAESCRGLRGGDSVRDSLSMGVVSGRGWLIQRFSRNFSVYWRMAGVPGHSWAHSLRFDVLSRMLLIVYVGHLGQISAFRCEVSSDMVFK